MKQSLVYKNIYLYRSILNVIYLGLYRSRFKKITYLLKGTDSVVDLCFGDIYIAKYCKKHNINWIGYDLNPSFVDYAIKKGYNACCKDILSIDSFPKCSVCIIQGSLYHFNSNLNELFTLIFNSTNRIIISEPIRNLSSEDGLIGQIAKKSANVGKGNEVFRFTKETFIQMLEEYRYRNDFEYTVVYQGRDIVVDILHN